MARETFEQALQKLRDKLLRLGHEVAAHLVTAVQVLQQRDRVGAEKLIRADDWVNELRIEIGMDGLRLIATQQPTAGDMRLIAAVIEIAGELERIHDYIKGIARINLRIPAEKDISPFTVHMPGMAEMAQKMLQQALAAFTERDAELASKVPAIDDEVDALYNKSYRLIIKEILAHPAELEGAQQLEWAAHNLERSADRVINICEWTVYMITGKYAEMDTKVGMTL